MRLLHVKHYFTFLFLMFWSIQQFGQVQKELNVGHVQDFSNNSAINTYCLDDVFYDSQGKMWLSTCLISRYNAAGLVNFDGYRFTQPSPHPSILKKLRQNYIGIKDDKVYGYTDNHSTTYLFYYNIKKNAFHVYDSLQLASQKIYANRHYYNDKFYPVFQKIAKDTLYTYVLQGDRVQLITYDHKLNRSTYNFISLPENTDDNALFLEGHNAKANWYYGIDFNKNAVVAINLITAEKLLISIPEDLSPYNQKVAKVQIVRNKLIIHLLNLQSKYENLIFKFEDDHINTLTYINSIFTRFEESSTYFEDKKGQYIYRFYDTKQKKTKLHITTKNGDVYDVSKLLNQIGDESIVTMKGNDFLTEIIVLTQRGFHLFHFKKDYTIEKINTNGPVRGIDRLDEKRLLYLAETGINEEQIYNTAREDVVRNPGICKFDTQKLLRNGHKIWGISTGNVAFYDTQTEKCKTIPLKQDVFNFAFDHEGNLIVMDREFQFWNFNWKTAEVFPLKHEGQTLKIGDRYNDFLVDGNGILWIATLSGLYSYNLIEKQLRHINTSLPNFDFSFISLAQRNQDELLLGSFDSGLLIFNTKDFSYKQISTAQGLSNNTIASITKDQDGYYWIGTYHGVGIINPQGKLLTNLYEEDGLAHNESNRFSAKLLPNGHIAIGSNDGISVINPRSVTAAFQQEKDMRIYLTSLSFFDAEKDEKMTYSHGFQDMEQIHLPAENKNLRLEFATTNYASPSSNSFAYQIEGLHQDWISLGNTPRLSIESLPSGKYVLKIKAIDKQGYACVNTLRLPIVAHAFFYEQIWFYMLTISIVVILALASIWLLKIRIKKATERIAADNHKLEQQSKKLAQLDKAKNEFFTNITHEFRTPLTLINGITDVLQRKYATAEAKELGEIQQNANSLLDMVNQILGLRKLRSDQLQLHLIQADVVMYISYVVDSHRYLALKKDIQLQLKTNEDEILMDFDPDQLNIILSNLISNAIKFTPNDGHIDVNLKYNKNKDELIINVIDTGVGFSENELKHAFELFHHTYSSTSPSQLGSGIGLYYSKKLVELMQGQISIQSQKHKGANIEVILPITNQAVVTDIQKEKRDRSSSVEAANPQEPIPSKKDYTLLIVEDNASVSDLLKMQLAPNYNLIFARDGEEGIDKALAEAPDLIISDVMMPVKDGFELCETLKADIHTSHIPIVLLTAKVDHGSKLKGLELKADVYLKKPFDFNELQLHITNLLETRKTLREVYKTLESKPTTSLQPKEDEFVLKFKSVIYEHIKDSDFKISDLCEALKISRAGLHNKIKALTGLSTANFVNCVKMQKAKELLEKDRERNISEISFDVGITNTNYFSRLFKDEIGLSPRQYKWLFRSDHATDFGQTVPLIKMLQL